MIDPTDHLIDLYRCTFLRHGTIPAGVGWGSKSFNIERRYTNILNSLMQMSEVLGTNSHFCLIDLGAGYGELLRYLDPSSLFVSHYCGVEPMTEAFTELASTCLLGYSFSTSTFNCQISDFFDYCSINDFSQDRRLYVLNGVFTQKGSISNRDFSDFLLDSIRLILNSDEDVLGLVFNTMSSSPAYKLETLFYPSRLLISSLADLCRSLGHSLFIWQDEALCEAYFEIRSR